MTEPAHTVAPAATVKRVSPNPPRPVNDDDKKRITAAIAKQRKADTAKAEADKVVREAVLAAIRHGASVRELAAFTGFSTSTISQWKREAR